MRSITDVPGIRLGHAWKSDAGWLSGVTVVLPPPGTIGSVDVRGGGPGTHETDALDPTTLVSTVDAVVLTGGSAFGLIAAHGVQRWCEEQGRGFPVPGGVVPIVPAAAVFDLGRGGDFAARPDAAMGYAAVAAAEASGDHADVVRGNVGAGTGALIAGGRFKGGMGTSSLAGGRDVVVGAVAVVNALGTLTGASGERVASPNFRSDGSASDGSLKPGLNTTLVVVATNAILDAAECRRTASAAHAGIARALEPSHTLADGDTVFVLATGTVALDRSSETARQSSLITLQSAAAEAVRLAIVDGVMSAETVRTPVATFPAFGAPGA